MDSLAIQRSLTILENRYCELREERAGLGAELQELR